MKVMEFRVVCFLFVCFVWGFCCLFAVIVFVVLWGGGGGGGLHLFSTLSSFQPSKTSFCRICTVSLVFLYALLHTINNPYTDKV